jgi:hypothetical protein
MQFMTEGWGLKSQSYSGVTLFYISKSELRGFGLLPNGCLKIQSQKILWGLIFLPLDHKILRLQ